MDERIDLTENRDFRDNNEISSRVNRLQMVLKRQDNLIPDSDFHKELKVENGKLHVSKTRKDLLHFDDKYMCHRCGRKHFSSSTICDRCNEELTIEINQTFDTRISIISTISSDIFL